MYTCVFLAMTCQNVVREKDVLVRYNVQHHILTTVKPWPLKDLIELIKCNQGCLRQVENKL